MLTPKFICKIDLYYTNPFIVYGQCLIVLLFHFVPPTQQNGDTRRRRHYKTNELPVRKTPEVFFYHLYKSLGAVLSL